MTEVNTIFWDWNGTLLNDVQECIEIINVSLKKRSLQPLVLGEYLEKFEFPIKKYYENIGFDFSAESYEQAGQEYINAYSGRMFECQLHQGAVNALSSFQQKGVKQFVLSALFDGALQQCVKHFQLATYFDMVRGLDNSYAHSKIELGQRLIAETGCDKSRAVMVGDTVHDYETASAMGISCVLIAAGHNSRDRLLACGVPVYDSILSFVSQFDSLCMSEV